MGWVPFEKVDFNHIVEITEETVVESIEDVLFDIFKDENEKVNAGRFITALESTGLRRTDPRLKEMMITLKEILAESSSSMASVDSLCLDLHLFKRLLKNSVSLLSKAFREQFGIPQFQEFTKHIKQLYLQCSEISEGKVADYIPQLAEYKPHYWGVSLCTVDGQRFSMGDVLIPFTLQSVSKPIVYSMALNELGAERVHKFVGQEPSGRMFNELVLDYSRAIMVAGLIQTLFKPEMNRSQKFDYTQTYFKNLSGGEYVGFNNSAFLSERDNADRNFALAYYMRENKCFPVNTPLMEVMDYYFQSCSLESHCESVAVMAATFANGGVCPITDEKIVKPEAVRDVLSLMHSCGMYDYSGQFAFKDMVRMFHLHRFECVRGSINKLGLYHHKYESKGSNIVALLFSAASGDVAAMRRMDMDQWDYDGRTALHLASSEGHLHCVRFLIEICRVSVDRKDRWGHTPLDDARIFGHEEVYKYLKGRSGAAEAE